LGVDLDAELGSGLEPEAPPDLFGQGDLALIGECAGQHVDVLPGDPEPSVADSAAVHPSIYPASRRQTTSTGREPLVAATPARPKQKDWNELRYSRRTPRGAADLAIEARRLVSRLADPGLKLAKSLLPGLGADPEGWVAELEPGLGRLEGLLHEIEVRRIAVSDGVIARRKALDASAETRRLVMGASEALFALAGEKELARRLRPRRRRRRDAAKPAPRRATGRLRSGLAAILEWLRRGLRRLKATAGALLGPGSRKSAESRVFPLSAGSLTARKA
jgi:hypothetical protein